MRSSCRSSAASVATHLPVDSSEFARASSTAILGLDVELETGTVDQ